MTRVRARSPLALAAMALVLCLGTAGAASVLSDLGVTEQAARNTIYDWFCGGGVYFPGSRQVFKSASGAARAEMVTAVLAFGKAYLQSDAFAARYAQFRDSNRPEAPEALATSGSNAMAREMEANIKQMQEEMKTQPPDVQKQMQEIIDSMRAQMKEMLDDPEMRQMMDEGAQRDLADRRARAEVESKEFDGKFPPDVNQLIAGRLRAFLDLTADIDFDAKTVSDNGVQTFADPKLEEKSSEWKYCFRAGKPAVDAARAFAQTWLKELGQP